jgi:hypothetical protein
MWWKNMHRCIKMKLRRSIHVQFMHSWIAAVWICIPGIRVLWGAHAFHLKCAVCQECYYCEGTNQRAHKLKGQAVVHVLIGALRDAVAQRASYPCSDGVDGRQWMTCRRDSPTETRKESAEHSWCWWAGTRPNFRRPPIWNVRLKLWSRWLVKSSLVSQHRRLIWLRAYSCCNVGTNIA